MFKYISFFLIIFSVNCDSSFYDINKTFFENSQLDFKTKDLPVINRKPKDEWIDFLGYKVASQRGVAACSAMTSKGIGILSQLGFDVLTYKTIRSTYNSGNSLPNIVFVEQEQINYQDIGKEVKTKSKSNNIAIANSVGIPSSEPEFVIQDIYVAKKSLLEGQVLIVSVYGENKKEFVNAATTAKYSGADIIELNFSCPNLVQKDEVYLNPDLVFDIAQEVVQACVEIPVIIKVGVFKDKSLMKEVFIAAHKAGIKGVCGINAVQMRVVDEKGNLAFDQRTMAGVSGKPIRKLALDFVKCARQIIEEEGLDLKILATGGVTQVVHFDEFISAGADIAMSASTIMWDPYILLKEKLALRLFEIGAIKFGDFVLKSGTHSNIYIDLRVAISYPDVLEDLAFYILNNLEKDEIDLVCGVPYAAVPLATAVALKARLPMIMARKEVKDYGTKNNIEGVYKQHQKCLLIEDIVTSGASILQAAQVLEGSLLKIAQVIVIIDRQQGGAQDLEKKGYNVSSIFKLDEFLQILKNAKKIDQDFVVDKELSYKQRANYCQNSMGKKLLNLMNNKKTNLAVAADVKTKKELLTIAEAIGPEICILKTHIDIIEDYDDTLLPELKKIADKHNFLIFEDRKFADIGMIAAKQFEGGIYKISNWADLVTVHTISGGGTLDALKSVSNNVGFILLAQMSSKGSLANGDYTKATVSLADKYSDNIMGFICREKLSNNPGFIHFTPGVQFNQKSDDFGQQYLDPEKVILDLKSDVVIVGRGVLQAQDPKTAAQKYRGIAWQAYLKRTS